MMDMYEMSDTELDAQFEDCDAELIALLADCDIY